MFNVMYSSQAKKFLKSSEKIVVIRILKKIERIQEEPIIHDSKRIQKKNLFRIRVGKFRILYEIDYTNNLIGIVKIDKRPRVY